MNQPPQRPILGWLLPDPHSPPGPGRMQRIAPRGPLRVALLATTTLLTASVAGSAALAAAGTSIAALVIVSALAALALIVVSRGWTIGTYVSDAGYAVRGLLRDNRGTWAQVARIDDAGSRCVIVRADGSRVRTQVTAHGLDFLGRPEAYAIARSRLRRWQADGSAAELR